LPTLPGGIASSKLWKWRKYLTLGEQLYFVGTLLLKAQKITGYAKNLGRITLWPP